MQNCLWVEGGECGSGGREERAQRSAPWESGWRLEEEPEPPQSPSGAGSRFAPDKQARSCGKLGFGLGEKENAACFQPGLPGRPPGLPVFPSHLPLPFSWASGAYNFIGVRSFKSRPSPVRCITPTVRMGKLRFGRSRVPWGRLGSSWDSQRLIFDSQSPELNHLLLRRVCSQLWGPGWAWTPSTTHALHPAPCQGPTCPYCLVRSPGQTQLKTEPPNFKIWCKPKIGGVNFKGMFPHFSGF